MAKPTSIDIAARNPLAFVSDCVVRRKIPKKRARRLKMNPVTEV